MHCGPSGGLLTPSTSELAFVNAAIFAGKPLRFLALDQIIFSRPVPIGAVVRMKAVTVTSTRPKTDEELADGLQLTSAGNAKVHVVVTAQIQDVAKGVSLCKVQRNAAHIFFALFSLERRRTASSFHSLVKTESLLPSSWYRRPTEKRWPTLRARGDWKLEARCVDTTNLYNQLDNYIVH